MGPGARGKAPGKPAARGFTLIEVALVIMILGIMIGLVIPSLNEMTGANLRRSVRHLTSLIRFLRDDAQAKKAVYRLRFDVQGGSYWTEKLTRTPEGLAEFKRLQSAVSSKGSLSGDTTFRDVVVKGHSGDPYVLFTPDGWVEKAFIHLRDGHEDEYTLVVSPLTGNTDLREGYLEER